MKWSPCGRFSPVVLRSWMYSSPAARSASRVDPRLPMAAKRGTLQYLYC